MDDVSIERPPLNDADVAWVKERVESGVEDTLHGVTNSEILWGGPRGPGLVYVVADLVKATSSLSSVTVDLRAAEVARSQREETSEIARIAREKRSQKNWTFAKHVFYWIVTPSVSLPFLRLVYISTVPWANAHGAHLPYLESGVKPAK